MGDPPRHEARREAARAAPLCCCCLACLLLLLCCFDLILCPPVTKLDLLPAGMCHGIKFARFDGEFRIVVWDACIVDLVLLDLAMTSYLHFFFNNTKLRSWHHRYIYTYVRY